jgi:histidine ammonia-lyase
MTPEVLSASLDAAPFTIDDLVALASGKAALHIPEAARDRLTAARAVVERYAALDEPVYGLTTALGGNLGFRIEPADRRAFQEQIVLGRAIGAGEPLPELVCRAALIARCISLARGGAGVSRSLLDLLCAMVEKQVTPVIPRHGSIGAGDLGLAAHIGAVVIGRGEAWYAGERLPGGEALAAAGLAPVELAGRDGHALCSTSVVTTVTLRSFSRKPDGCCCSLHTQLHSPPRASPQTRARSTPGRRRCGRRRDKRTPRRCFAFCSRAVT